MAELEDKLGAILNDPQMMQQLTAMAQALGSSQQETPQSEAMPVIDPTILRKLTSLAGQGQIDQRQKALLGALGGYLSHQRISRLERAMRAAQLAKIATAALGSKALF